MHDLTGIPLCMLILELGRVWLVCTIKASVSLQILILGLEYFGAGGAPWLLGIELCCVFVGAKVHSKGELVFCQLASFNQVMMIVRVANKINIEIGGSCNGLATVSTLNHALKLRASCLNLTTGVTRFCQYLVGIISLKVVVAC